MTKHNDPATLVAVIKSISFWLTIRDHFPCASTYQVFEATFRYMQTQPETQPITARFQQQLSKLEERIRLYGQASKAPPSPSPAGLTTDLPR